MKRRIVHTGPGALDLIEEAVHLLRGAPAATIGGFYAGAAPFVVGLLFFWADMSRSPLAAGRCAASALGLAAAWLWMRVWQAWFCAALRARRAGQAAPAWGARDVLAVAGAQLRLATWAWLGLLPSLLALIPFGWVYAYYHSLAAMYERPAQETEDARARAWRLASLWPHQNHYAISILVLFGLFVWINLVSAMVVIPFLAKSLLGFESAFTRNPGALLNTTFVAVSFAGVWLCVAPVVKAVYALRCFHGEAIRTGRDLLTELGGSAPRPRRAALAALGLALVAAVLPARGGYEAVARPPAASPPAAARGAPSPDRLDATIERVMARPEYTWRMPRDLLPAEKEQRWFGRMMDDIARAIKRFLRWIGRMIERMGEAIDRMFRRSDAARDDAGGAGSAARVMRSLAWVLLGGLALFAAWYVWRTRERLRAARSTAAPVAPAATPDLEDESLTASHLPEEEWLALAADLRAQGELRKALRAGFLGTLACLARLEMVVIARAKSNLEYRRELARRARRTPQVDPLFGEDVTLFERAWYGRHPATDEAIDTLLRNLEGIRHAGPA